MLLRSTGVLRYGFTSNYYKTPLDACRLLGIHVVLSLAAPTWAGRDMQPNPAKLPNTAARMYCSACASMCFAVRDSDLTAHCLACSPGQGRWQEKAEPATLPEFNMHRKVKIHTLIGITISQYQPQNSKQMRDGSVATDPNP